MLLAGATVAAVCALSPLVYLLVRSAQLGAGGAVDTLLRERLWSWTLASTVLVLAVTTTCLVAGTVIAWLLTATRLPGARWWLVVSALPLAVPSYVAAFSWLSTVPTLQGFWPTWAVLSAACLPYVVLPTAAALRGADLTLVEVARAAGCGPLGAWRRGLVPQVLPAAAAGALLAGLYALADFGTPALMRHEVLPFAIQRQYGSFLGRERAALLALVLVAMAALMVLLERRARGNAQRWSTGSGSPRPLRAVHLGAWAVPATVLVALPVVVGAAWPVIGLFRRLALGTRRTLDWGELTDAVVATAGVSLAGGAVALVLAGLVGSLAARHGGRVVGALESASFAGHALPGIVVGLSLVYLSLQVVPGLYQSVVVLAFAYVVLFLPKAVGAVRTSVAAVPPVLAQVAGTLGRSRRRAGLVTVRLALPGVTAGFLLVVVTAMKELPATLLLRPSGLDTLATEMWSRTSSAAQGAAAPYALALVLLASVPAFLLTRTSTWDRS